MDNPFLNTITQQNPNQQLIDQAISAISPQYRDAAQQYVPLIVAALDKEGILTPQVLAYALATAQYESSLKPIAEVNGQQQAVNNNYEGGPQYYGRGFIQLTHKSNYDDMDKQLGLNGQLSSNPDMALDPQVAAQILAKFIKSRGVADLANKGDFYGARGPVNGTDKAQEIANTAQGYLQGLSGQQAQAQPPNVLTQALHTIAPPVQAAELPQSYIPAQKPISQPAQNFTTNPNTYTVKPGDNLYNISKQYLGQGNRFNEIKGYASGNPSLIRPGEVLTLPNG